MISVDIDNLEKEILTKININTQIMKIIKKLDLINYSNWLVWKKEIRNGKETKLPYNAKNDKSAKTNESSTWANYKNAVKTYQNGGYDGIGFVFSVVDPFCGIDLDKCRDPETEKIDQWAKNVIKKLHSYTEVSPSGTGIHIIVKAELPPGGNKTGNLPVDWEAPSGAEIEMYDQKRYFTMTLHKLEGAPAQAEDRQKEIEALHNKVFSQKEREQKREQNYKPKNNLTLTDQELIDKAKQAQNSNKFRTLWEGDISSYKSHSEADQALCDLLAFWTKKDPERMDQLFRQSGLMREKWDRKWGDSTYGFKTIENAIAFTQDIYSPQQKEIEEGMKEIVATKEDTELSKKEQFFDKKTFIPKRLADEIMSKYEFRYSQDKLWHYKAGVYISDSESLIKNIGQKLLDDFTRDNRIKETINFIKRANFSGEPQINEQFINLKNGRLDWKTGTLIQHNSNDFIITQLPVKYDPEADYPIFKKYLETTFNDDNIIELALEFMGYCLIPDNSYQKAVMLTGAGSNGKTVFLETIKNLLGSRNVSNIDLHELEENRFKAAELLGKLANIFADLDSRGLKRSTMFKTLVGGDRITAERKFKDPFEFNNYARLLFSANELPRSQDRTYAFYRRWIIIPFEKTFTDDNADKNLLKKLKDELPGILNLALNGLRKLKEDGQFIETEKTIEAKEEYKKQNDSVAAFIDERVIESTDSFITKQSFYREYKDWCENAGLKSVSQKSPRFKMSIYDSLTIVDEFRNGTGGPWCWLNICFK